MCKYCIWTVRFVLFNVFQQKSGKWLLFFFFFGLIRLTNLRDIWPDKWKHVSKNFERYKECISLVIIIVKLSFVKIFWNVFCHLNAVFFFNLYLYDLFFEKFLFRKKVISSFQGICLVLLLINAVRKVYWKSWKIAKVNSIKVEIGLLILLKFKTLLLTKLYLTLEKIKLIWAQKPNQTVISDFAKEHLEIDFFVVLVFSYEQKIIKQFTYIAQCMKMYNKI